MFKYCVILVIYLHCNPLLKDVFCKELQMMDSTMSTVFRVGDPELLFAGNVLTHRLGCSYGGSSLALNDTRAKIIRRFNDSQSTAEAAIIGVIPYNNITAYPTCVLFAKETFTKARNFLIELDKIADEAKKLRNQLMIVLTDAAQPNTKITGPLFICSVRKWIQKTLELYPNSLNSSETQNANQVKSGQTFMNQRGRRVKRQTSFMNAFPNTNQSPNKTTEQQIQNQFLNSTQISNQINNKTSDQISSFNDIRVGLTQNQTPNQIVKEILLLAQNPSQFTAFTRTLNPIQFQNLIPILIENRIQMTTENPNQMQVMTQTFNQNLSPNQAMNQIFVQQNQISIQNPIPDQNQNMISNFNDIRIGLTQNPTPNQIVAQILRLAQNSDQFVGLTKTLNSNQLENLMQVLIQNRNQISAQNLNQNQMQVMTQMNKNDIPNMNPTQVVSQSQFQSTFDGLNPIRGQTRIEYKIFDLSQNEKQIRVGIPEQIQTSNQIAIQIPNINDIKNGLTQNLVPNQTVEQIITLAQNTTQFVALANILNPTQLQNLIQILIQNRIKIPTENLNPTQMQAMTQMLPQIQMRGIPNQISNQGQSMMQLKNSTQAMDMQILTQNANSTQIPVLTQNQIQNRFENLNTISMQNKLDQIQTPTQLFSQGQMGMVTQNNKPTQTVISTQQQFSNPVQFKNQMQTTFQNTNPTQMLNMTMPMTMANMPTMQWQYKTQQQMNPPLDYYQNSTQKMSPNPILGSTKQQISNQILSKNQMQTSFQNANPNQMNMLMPTQKQIQSSPQKPMSVQLLSVSQSQITNQLSPINQMQTSFQNQNPTQMQIPLQNLQQAQKTIWNQVLNTNTNAIQNSNQMQIANQVINTLGVGSATQLQNSVPKTNPFPIKTESLKSKQPLNPFEEQILKISEMQKQILMTPNPTLPLTQVLTQRAFIKQYMDLMIAPILDYLESKLGKARDNCELPPPSSILSTPLKFKYNSLQIATVVAANNLLKRSSSR